MNNNMYSIPNNLPYEPALNYTDQDSRLWGWGWGYGRPWGYGYGAPFLGGFLGGLATGALLSPYGYGFGYPYYGYPYGGFWY